MRLRAEHPRVTRLSRRVLAGMRSGRTTCNLRCSDMGLAEQPFPLDGASRTLHDRPSQCRRRPYQSSQETMPVYLARALPLGPALPGDLGRPILNAQNAPSATVSAIDAEQQAHRSGSRSGALEQAVCVHRYPRAGVAISPIRLHRGAATSSHPGQPAQSTG